MVMDDSTLMFSIFAFIQRVKEEYDDVRADIMLGVPVMLGGTFDDYYLVVVVEGEVNTKDIKKMFKEQFGSDNIFVRLVVNGEIVA